MAQLQPFKAGGATTAIALTTTLTSVAATLPLDGDGENVMIVNACSVPVTVVFYPPLPVAAVAATVTSPYVIPASGRMLVTVGRMGPLLAAAMPIGTASASVYLTRGDGSSY